MDSLDIYPILKKVNEFENELSVRQSQELMNNSILYRKYRDECKNLRWLISEAGRDNTKLDGILIRNQKRIVEGLLLQMKEIIKKV